MRGNETPERIVIGVGIYDVITSANFYDYHLRGLSLVKGGGQILGFSIDLRCRNYNTVIIAVTCDRKVVRFRSSKF